MKIFIAGPLTGWKLILQFKPPYLLESFYTLFNNRKSKQYIEMIKRISKIFLLDSGAFTFMNSKKDVSVKDLDKFVEQYAKFIKDNDIQLFLKWMLIL